MAESATISSFESSRWRGCRTTSSGLVQGSPYETEMEAWQQKPQHKHRLLNSGLVSSTCYNLLPLLLTPSIHNLLTRLKWSTLYQMPAEPGRRKFGLMVSPPLLPLLCRTDSCVARDLEPAREPFPPCLPFCSHSLSVTIAAELSQFLLPRFFLPLCSLLYLSGSSNWSRGVR